MIKSQKGMIKSQKGMKIRLHIQIRVNIPFTYKQDYHNIITELGAIICCQDLLPFFIDKKTKKRLIRSIPCKRKKKSPTLQHTPEFIDAPPRGERNELKLLGVMFSASNEEPMSVQLNAHK